MQKASASSRKKASRRETSKLSVLSCLENSKLMKFHRAPRNLRSLVAFLAFFDSLVPAWSQLATISAGSTHSCAVYGDGTLECWGDNGRGQLGQGYTSMRENSRMVTVVVRSPTSQPRLSPNLFGNRNHTQILTTPTFNPSRDHMGNISGGWFFDAA